MLRLVRRAIPHDRLTPHNEVAGFVYGVIGVVYAVILSFEVVSVGEQYSAAASNARQEADAIGNLYRIAEGLPEPSGRSLQAAALAYATAVVDDEWRAMDKGSAPSPQAIDQVDALWSALYGVEATTPSEERFAAAALEQIDALSDHRRERLESAESGLPSIMWAMMLGGGFLTVLIPCLFGVQNGLVHGVIIAVLAATIGLLLLVVSELNYPFRGDVSVEPDGFVLGLEQFGASPP